MKSLCTNPLHSGDRVHKNNRICNILTEYFICAECRTYTMTVLCVYVYRSYYKYTRLYKLHFYFSLNPPPLVPYTTYNPIDAHIAGELYILNPFKRLKATVFGDDDEDDDDDNHSVLTYIL